MDKFVKVAEQFYTDLYIIQSSEDNEIGSREEQSNVLPVTKTEVKKALEAMKKGKAAA